MAGMPELRRSLTDPLSADSPLGDADSPIRDDMTKKKGKTFTKVGTMNAAVAGSVDCSSPAAGSQEDKPDPGVVGTAVVALLACVMGAADGLSMGTIIFPSDKEHPNTDFKALGMSLGLLTTLVSNTALWLMSDYHCGVGGTIIPMVATMSTTFAALGPADTQTILLSVSLASVISGSLIWISGFLPVKKVINVCPFGVFGGFLAGTGATLFDFGYQLIVPGFTSLSDTGPKGARMLLEPDCLALVWAPTVVALGLFLTDRWGLIRSRTLNLFLMPLTLLAMLLVFYVWMLATGKTLADLRASHFLFQVEFPSGLDFQNVWTIRDFSAIDWDALLSVSFLVSCVKVYLIGLLTTVKNIYATKESTGYLGADIDKEIRVSGVTCVVAGILGSIPGNLVNSFTMTADRLGMPIDRASLFHPFLAAFSLLFFIFGDFVIAALPAMIPGRILLWLGLLFCVFWLYDVAGKLPASEYAVVVLMTATAGLVGPDAMVGVGLFCTFIIVAFRMHSMEPCLRVTSLGLGAHPESLCGQVSLIRSDMRRTNVCNVLLAKYGKGAIILFPKDLMFTTLSKIMEELVGRFEGVFAEEGREAPTVLVLQIDGLAEFGIDFLNFAKELSGMSAKKGCTFIVSGIEDEPLHALEKYGMTPPMLRLSYEECHKRNAPDVLPGQVVVIPHSGVRGGRAHHPYCASVGIAEDVILRAHHAEKEKGASFVAIDGSNLLNAAPDANERAVIASGVPRHHAAFSVAMEIYRWLNQHDRGFRPELLPRMLEAVDVVSYEAGGDAIYDPGSISSEMLMASRAGNVPPVVWLLRGEIEHLWLGGQWEDVQLMRQYEERFHIIPGGMPRVESGYVSAGDAKAGLLIGPFSTINCFRAQTPGVAKLAAVTPGTACALLHRDRLSALLRKDSDAFETWMVYLGRVDFVRHSDPTVKVPM